HLGSIPMCPLPHDIAYENAEVTVVVFIALPERAERINRQLPVVAKIPAECFYAAAVKIAAKSHPLLIRLPAITHFIAGLINDRFAVLVFELLALVAEVEVQLAIGPKDESMNPVIVLRAADAAEQ